MSPPSSFSNRDDEYLQREEMFKNMTEEERAEAARYAAIAEAAERRHAEKSRKSQEEQQQTVNTSSISEPQKRTLHENGENESGQTKMKFTFKTKKQREQEAQKRAEEEKKKEKEYYKSLEIQRKRFERGEDERTLSSKQNKEKNNETKKTLTKEEQLREEEKQIILNSLNGVSTVQKPSTKTTTHNVVMKHWSNNEDTSEMNDSFYTSIKRINTNFSYKRDTYDSLSKYQGKAGGNLKGDSWKNKKLEDMTTRDWNKFRMENQIRIKGSRDIFPIRFWEDGQFDKNIKRAIHELGFEDVRPIQAQAIPIGLHQRDLIGIAQTGSGKTVAFLVPLLQYILDAPLEMRIRSNEYGPLAVIMAPTRELAQQINRDMISLSKYCYTEGLSRSRNPGIKTLCIIGGESLAEQSSFMSAGIDVIVATPGRVFECIEKRIIVLNQCNYIVLDEADRMIDIGFEKELNTVLSSMGSLLKSENDDEIDYQISAENRNRYKYRTTAMFSATMSRTVEAIATSFLRSPIVITIGDESQAVNSDIEQIIRFVKPEQKMKKLEKVLDESEYPIIIFCNTKDTVNNVSKSLRNRYRVRAMHSGKSQDEREDILNDFRDGIFDILVATDVLARGVDIKGVKLVVNYDMPIETNNMPVPIDTYIHRIGRTGRAGMKGKAISFITEQDEGLYIPLTEYLSKNNSKIPRELKMNENVRNALGDRLNPGEKNVIFQ